MNNDYLIQITGKAYIAAPLANDTSYQFTGEITTYGVDERSNQDGTQKITHKAKFSDVVHLIKGDEIIKGKDTKSWSQKLRGMVFHRGHDYDEFMPYLLTRIEDIFYDYETR